MRFPAAPFFPKTDGFGAFRAGLIVLVFCAIMVAFQPHFFWNDDAQLGCMPGYEEIARAWWHGELPLLSSSSWVAGNIIGEWQAGTFSIFVNLCAIVICKLPLTIANKAAGISMAHLFVLASGAYLLARQRRLSPALATMVSLVASLNGWIICWAATDWISVLTCLAWLPWAWWALEKALGSRSIRDTLLAGFFVYLDLAAASPFPIVLLGAVSAWLFVKQWIQTRSLLANVPLVIAWVCGLGLTAPGWLVFLEYMKGSGRVTVGMVLQKQWLVPWNSLPALILPTFITDWRCFLAEPGAHLSIEMACGLVPATALLGALILCGKKFVSQFRWDLLLLVCVLVCCALPSVGMFRWSFRWLPLFHLVLALVGAEAVAAIEAHRLKTGSVKGFAKLVANLPLWSLVLVLFTWGATSLAGSVYPTASLIVCAEIVFICVAWTCLVAWPALSAWRGWLATGVVAANFLSLYLHIPTTLSVPAFNLGENQTDAGPLDSTRWYLSIYQQPEAYYTAENTPPGFGTLLRPGITQSQAGLKFINGYSAIVPFGIAQILKSYGHGEIDLGAAQKLIEAGLGPDGALALLGVDGIVIAKRLPGAVKMVSREWNIVYTSDEATVLHRPGPPSPRVRAFAANGTNLPQVQFAHFQDGRNRASVEVQTAADQPATITFARPWFSGYRAWLDGQPLAVECFRAAMPAVKIPPGAKGKLTLLFCPSSLLVGLFIASITFIGMSIALFLHCVNQSMPSASSTPATAEVNACLNHENSPAF